MILQLQDVSKTYQSADQTVHALQNASLEVDSGEFLVVRGPSGSGKTTLLLIAGTLLRPDSGTVLVNGEDPYGAAGPDRAKLRAETIGFVFQQFHLVPYLNVLDNVLAPGLTLSRESRPAIRERAGALLERLGITPLRRKLPGQLSTGERQRVALARALINEPRLLLADEPTGNLDPVNSQIVLTELSSFIASGGAVVVVTHHEYANDYAGRTINIVGGRIEGA